MGTGHQRPSSAVLQPISKPLVAPLLLLALEVSLAKPAGCVDPCIKLFGGFYGVVVGQRFDQQGLSVAMPGRVGVVPWTAMEQFKPLCGTSCSVSATGSAEQQDERARSPNW